MLCRLGTDAATDQGHSPGEPLGWRRYPAFSTTSRDVLERVRRDQVWPKQPASRSSRIDGDTDSALAVLMRLKNWDDRASCVHCWFICLTARCSLKPRDCLRSHLWNDREGWPVGADASAMSASWPAWCLPPMIARGDGRPWRRRGTGRRAVSFDSIREAG